MFAEKKKIIIFAPSKEEPMMKTILNLLLTTILLTAVLLTANAQENDGDWRKYLDLWGEIEDVEGSDWKTAEEVMSELAAHPININTARTCSSCPSSRRRRLRTWRNMCTATRP